MHILTARNLKFKKMKSFFTALFFVPLLIQAQNLQVLSDQAKITFDVGDEVELGTVSGLTTNIKLNLNDLDNSSIEASVDPKTIKTHDAGRDEHVTTGDDYLDGNVFPKITFKSNKIIKTESGYMAYGDLTIKDVTKSVNMPFVNQNNQLIGRMKFHLGNFGLHGTPPEDESAVNCVVRIEVPVK